MNYQEYIEWLGNKLLEALVSAGYDPNEYQISVYLERDFEKAYGDNRLPSKGLLFVVSIEEAVSQYNITSRTITINAWSEANTFYVAQNVCNEFARLNNNLVEKDGDNNVTKHSYEQAIISEPFGLDGFEYRATFAIYGSYIVLESYANLQKLEYIGSDGSTLVLYDENNSINKLLSFQLSYANSCDTQVIGNDQISNSVSSSAVLTLTIVIPNERTILLEDILKQVSGKNSSDSGYAFRWTYFDTDFDFATTRQLKLSAFSSTILSDNSPTISIGFQA